MTNTHGSGLRRWWRPAASGFSSVVASRSRVTVISSLARRRRSRGLQSPQLVGDPRLQLLEGVGELLHALRLERLRDVVVVDAGLGELLEQAMRLVEALDDGVAANLAVVLEGLDRLARHRV